MVEEVHEVFSAEEISKLKDFKITKIYDGESEEVEHIAIEFIGPKGEEAVLIIEDAVLFYGNELNEVD